MIDIFRGKGGFPVILIDSSIDPCSPCIAIARAEKPHAVIKFIQLNCCLALRKIAENSFPRRWHRCIDYLRLYLDVETTELVDGSRWNYELCGDISTIPKQHFSSANLLILEFHSSRDRGNNTGFRGIYKFVDKGKSSWWIVKSVCLCLCLFVCVCASLCLSLILLLLCVFYVISVFRSDLLGGRFPKTSKCPSLKIPALKISLN